MTFTKEQRQSAYGRLSEEVRDFIMSNDTTDIISKILSDSGLNKNISVNADSEVLYAMFGLQTLDQAVAEIAKISGKNANDLQSMKSRLKTTVFDKILEIKSKAQAAPKVISALPEIKPANLPMVEPGETAHSVKPGEIKVVAPPPQIPKGPLTFEERKKQILETKKEVPNAYASGVDPYKEPI